MPPPRRSGRSRVNRLPKAERRAPAPKVVVLGASEVSRPRPYSFQQAQSVRTPSPVQSARTSQYDSVRLREWEVLPSLPDDAWRKILLYAGTRAVFSCLRVSTQLRHLAQDVLLATTTLDVSQHFGYASDTAQSERRVSATVPTDTVVLGTLCALPRLRTLVVARWPFSDAFPDIANVIASSFASTMLRAVTFSAVTVSSAALRRLLEACPSIDSVRLGDHPSVDDDTCCALAAACSPFRLYTLSLHDARRVSSKGVSALLRVPVASCLSLATLPRIMSLKYEIGPLAPSSSTSSDAQEHTFALHVTKCLNLGQAIFPAVRGSHNFAMDIQISQCRMLTDVSLEPSHLAVHQAAQVPENSHSDLGDEAHANFNACRLNLSGNSMLRDVWLWPRGGENSEPETMARACALPLLEDLNLYGARVLSRRTFAHTFGLCDATAKKMPRLRNLMLNGSSIETLVLDGYDHLTTVDVSGSSLYTLTVRGCWSLQCLVVLGRKMPLHTVSISVAKACDVVGRRPEWSWERFGTCQTLSFP